MDAKDNKNCENELSNSSLFSTWIEKAKLKTFEIVDFMKKDLEEFGVSVKTEATNVVSSTGTFLEKTLKFNEENSTTNTIKRSVSQLLDQVNTTFNSAPDDSDTDAMIMVGSEAVELTKLDCAILELQKDEKTYLKEPDESLEVKFNSWLKIADEQMTKSNLSKFLSNSSVLNDQYMKLVPDQVSHSVFWKRYLFKKALLEDEYALEERLSKLKIDKNHEKIDWDKENYGSHIELTEEEQNKILEDYEKELQFQSKEPSDQEHELEQESQPVNKLKSISKNSSAGSLENIGSNSNSDSDWVEMS